jgi:putative sugar O-methyltransferase
MSQLEGFLDGVDVDRIAGWAWDRADPEMAIGVDLFVDGTYACTVEADQLGLDLVTAGIGDGLHRWSCEVGRLNGANGKAHEISARFGGTDVELTNSPKKWSPHQVPPGETEGLDRSPLASARRLWSRVSRPAPSPQPETPASLPLERQLASLEQAPADEDAIVATLMASYKAAIDDQPSVAPPYLPGAGWATLLATEWRRYREAIDRGDDAELAGLLRNFFRNEGISGFWGGGNMFESFRDQEGEPHRANLMLAQYQTWRGLCPTARVAELAAPRIGNPWGYVIDGHVLYEPAFEYHYQARYFQGLVADVPTPTVLEIGGGFGGLGYQILKQAPGTKYIAFDLPENTLLQAYYLTCAFPQAKVLTYTKGMRQLDRQTIAAYDIIVLPNFMLPAVESAAADLVVNVRSLSEMPEETIAEYLRQIDRVGRLWFFHENIYKARGDDLFGVPSTQFPPLEQHVPVAAAVSRWPRYGAESAYPCQENLYLRRDVLTRHV